MADFSVIIPLYNCESSLCSLFDTLNKQQGENFDVIFVEDKSSDKTLDKFEKNKHHIKFKYQLIKNAANYGPGISRNIGLEHSIGKYIVFLDSDDTISAETMQLLTNIINECNSPDAIIFDYYMVCSNKKIKCDTIPNADEGFIKTNDAIIYMTGATWCKVYKSEIIKQHNIKFPDMRTKEDFVFNKIALSYCETIYYKKVYLYNYIVNTNSVMNTTKLSGQKNAKKAFEIVERKINRKHFTAIEKLKVYEYLFASVQSMLRMKKSSQCIKSFIGEFETETPSWYEQKNKLNNYTDIFLYFVKKRNILLLRIMIGVKDILKKILSI